MKLADRMNHIGVESAFDVLVRARALEAKGRSIVHLEIGEPDFPTPLHIVEAGKRALDEGWTHYGPTPGLPDLREALAADALPDGKAYYRSKILEFTTLDLDPAKIHQIEKARGSDSSARSKQVAATSSEASKGPSGSTHVPVVIPNTGDRFNANTAQKAALRPLI